MQNNHRANEKVTLSRSLGLFTITMIGVGGMIGAGIFVLTGIAAGVAGPALVLAFLLNGFVTLLTAMTYAELGSAYPEAGGGYLWVKEGLGLGQGFLAGWMSWFAHALAGSLYALGFGHFAVNFWTTMGLPTFGLSPQLLALLGMTFIIIIFTVINLKGVSEAGSVGNLVTMTKIFILVVFAIFGLLVMLKTGDWHVRFTSGFMPNGISGVLMAMGLTFIAFEGYEIISQSGEEVVNPGKNIPRAIFLAISIAVTIYLLVGITAIGATQPPAGMLAYQYLAEQKEIAVVQVAQQVFPYGIGGIVLLFSGLVSTMSALNATTFSSSRVSFAMGRDHNLPAIFARVHPQRHVPFWAVVFSCGLMLLMAWTLPIESVAASADIMFMFLFLQVNLAVIRLRRIRPDLDRKYKIPIFPAIPILAILCNAALSIFLFFYNPVAMLTAIGWIIVGYIVYSAYFSKIEAMEKPKEILMEEVLVSRDYSVVVPVMDETTASVLGRIGSIMASSNQGEVIAVNVINVPPQLTLGEGRLFLKEGRSYLEKVIAQAKALNVPVHTIIRLGRNIADAIRKTAVENAADLILLAWPGYTNSEGRSFGSVIDPLIMNPPVDIAVIRYHKKRPLNTILVPVSGGVNSRLAVKTAALMARYQGDGPITIRVMNILPKGASESDYVRAHQLIHASLEGIDHPDIEKSIVEGADIVETILEQSSEDCDLIIIGATAEPLFKRLLVGSIPEKVAKTAGATVIMVKRGNSRIHSMMTDLF